MHAKDPNVGGNNLGSIVFKSQTRCCQSLISIQFVEGNRQMGKSHTLIFHSNASLHHKLLQYATLSLDQSLLGMGMDTRW